MKKLIKKFLGIENKATKRNGALPVHVFENTMEAGLRRLVHLGLPVNTVIDVGAAEGAWSLKAMKYWNSQNYVLFEPLEERKDTLSGLAGTNSNFYTVHKAAGKEKGVIDLEVTDDLDGSSFSEKEISGKTRKVEIASIDDEITGLNLKGPYLLKLDTHGFEVPILEGAENTLKEASSVIIECYGFHLNSSSLLFSEMCGYMEKKGFRLYDIVDIMRREKDKAFWQCDAFFIPSDHPVFNSNTYR